MSRDMSLGGKLLSNMILIRLSDAASKVIREEQFRFRKGRGSVNQIFTLSFIIEKCLSYQTPLIFSFKHCEQASVDKRVLAKLLSLYAILYKWIKVISAIYETKTAAVKV